MIEIEIQPDNDFKIELGGGNVDLSNYATKAELNNKANQADLANKADKIHTHAISDIENLQSELDGKVNSAQLDEKLAGHQVDLSDYAKKTELDGKADKTELSDKANQSDLANKANVTHTHAISDIENLQSELDGKVNTAQLDEKLAGHQVDLSDYTTKAEFETKFSELFHGLIEEFENRFSELFHGLIEEFEKVAYKTDLANKADKIHTHAISDITGLQDELDGKVKITNIDDILLRFKKNIDDNLAVFTDYFEKKLLQVGGLGVNQTWQNQTSERQANIEYTNTADRPIMAVVTAQYSSYAQMDNNVGLYVNDVNVGLVSIGMAALLNNTPTIDLSVIIPAGAKYKFVSTNNPVSINRWMELR